MRTPECPYFGACGGCAFQDIDYEEQLKLKLSQLKDAIQFEDIKIFSGDEFHYRNRMDFVFHAGGLGLREKGSWYSMVDIEQCIIANQKLNLLLKEVRQFFKGVFYFDVKRRFGTYCYAVIRTPAGDLSVSIVINKKDKKLEEAAEKIKEFSQITSANNVVMTLIPHNRNVSVSDEFEVIKGSEFLKTSFLEQTFYFPVQGFLQVNNDMTKRVYSYCHDLLKEQEPGKTHLLDLYGGIGTFGISNSYLFKTVTILENYAPAIQAAEMNLKENNVRNVNLMAIDARRLAEVNLPHPLIIIVDPPRSGMHLRTLAQLKELTADPLIYVSCNVKHLAKDLEYLDNYRIKSAALFDMFPQTPHMEAVVELALE
jgi:23S rRNA (uracil1939-C5)-methyltransferase